MFYLARMPWLLKKFYSSCIWKGKENAIYLTFDDGPHPEITDFVLQQLLIFKAKASFFCIGKNVVAYPETYSNIIDNGHTIGNHTFSHLNGWKTKDSVYLEDIAEAKKYIDSNYYRPPYGRITPFQLKQLSAPRFNLTCIMWSLLSADFDNSLSPERCLEKLLLTVRGGDIVVFHDSVKADKNLQYVLPKFLEFCKEKGYLLQSIDSINESKKVGPE